MFPEEPIEKGVREGKEGTQGYKSRESLVSA